MNYFVSDVHLGLKGTNPQEREQRFVNWLKEAAFKKGDRLFLLGDIWDFWYEYKDVIPKEGIRVVAQLIDLMDKGIDVYFFSGNHDIWCYHFFEDIGIKVIKKQPAIFELDGHKVLLAHGDGVGGAKCSYRLMLRIFHSPVCQFLFSLLHPRLAFSIATRWSKSNRYSHREYHWAGKAERLYKYSETQSPDIEYFIFGHYHCEVSETLPSGARLIILKDWLSGGTPHLELEF